MATSTCEQGNGKTEGGCSNGFGNELKIRYFFSPEMHL